MSSLLILQDAVSPLFLAVPAIILLVVIASVIFGILWVIAYIRNRKKQ